MKKIFMTKKEDEVKKFFVCFVAFLVCGCATDGHDLQPMKRENIEFGTNFQEISAKLTAGKEYQDLSPNAQIEYIQNFTKYKILKLIIESNKISESTKRDYLLSLKSPEKIKKAIEEAPANVIKSKTELIREIDKTEQYYANFLYVPDEVKKVWIIMQDYGPLVDGSSEFYEFTDRNGLIGNFEKYVDYARKNNKRLLITASDANESSWRYQKEIKYLGVKLKEALYRSPDQKKNFFGVEVPL